MKDLVVDDGSSISYTVFEGTEPGVVILHGLAGSSREFVPTAAALAGRSIILVDQRGHGRSTIHPPDTSRDAFVADVVSVITAETSEPVFLVGQSMGAHTAMLLTAARPDLVRGLVMLEGDQGAGSADESAALGNYFRSWKVLSPAAPRPLRRAAMGRSRALGWRTSSSVPTGCAPGSTPT